MKPFDHILISILMLYSAASCSVPNQAQTGSWQIAGELPPLAGQQASLGVAGPVTGTVHDLLVVGGGANFPGAMPWQGGKKKYYDEVYLFSREAGERLQLRQTAKLPFPLAYAASTTVPQGVVSAGGENDSGISHKVLLIQWDTAGDSLIVRYLPDLPQAVTNASLTSVGNVLYLAGGETADGVSQGFYSLDLEHASAGWVKLPHLPQPVSHAVMVSQSNGAHPCVYVIGGRKRNAGATSDLYASVYQFDPESNQWSLRRPLPYSLSAGTGAAIGNNRIALFGGDRGETFHKTEELIAAIAKEPEARRKQELTEQKAALQAGHPGFSKEMLLYDTEKDVWESGGVLPFETPATTTAVKWGSEVILPSGEIRAGVRTPRILAGRLKNEL